MTATTAYDSLNNLPEDSFIGGTDKTLTFSCYASDGANPNRITGATIYWRLCPYGEFGINTLEKSTETTGINMLNGSGGQAPFNVDWEFEVELLDSDTVSLSGKFIQQVVITDYYGKTFIPGQGSVIIFPSITAT
jgi:hypothetical protein